MIYPYTIINRAQANQFYNILVSFGYTPSFGIKTLLRRFPNPGNIYIVINDCGIFGTFCFYRKGWLAPGIERTFIEDPYKFLKEAAKYKNCVEY